MAFVGATEFGVDVNELESRARAATQPPTGGATTMKVEPAGQAPPIPTAAPVKEWSTLEIAGWGAVLLGGLWLVGRK